MTKLQLWELRQFFTIMAFVYAQIVPSWPDQLLPQLLIEQFDTLHSQYRHIEHMHEGVRFQICFLDKMTDMRQFFPYKLWYIELSGVNVFVYFILTNV